MADRLDANFKFGLLKMISRTLIFMTPNHRIGGFGQWQTTEDRLTDETMILTIAYIDGPDFETSSLLGK